MRRVQKTIGLATDSDATVLILGETGTGKELVARALHEHSQRKAMPFVAVNCAAIPGEFAAAGVYAQTAGSIWDPSQLPETKGTVKQYTLTPRGDVDGLILNDGTEIKLPPHLSSQVVYAIRPGDAVTIPRSKGSHPAAGRCDLSDQ